MIPRTSGAPSARRARRARQCRRRRRPTSPASPSTRPARWSCATAPARSSASRPAAASAGTPSSGSTIARSTRPTTAPRPATRVLDYLGGVMSPEMQTPKLMWIKRNLPEIWERAGQFFDLADFLTYRASGSNARSQCTLACKWTYLAHEETGWQQDFFDGGRHSRPAVARRPAGARQPRRHRSRPADRRSRRGARPHHATAGSAPG